MYNMMVKGKALWRTRVPYGTGCKIIEKYLAFRSNKHNNNEKKKTIILFHWRYKDINALLTIRHLAPIIALIVIVFTYYLQSK